MPKLQWRHVCKTRHHFKVRLCEHLGISHITEKKVKIDNNKLTVIQEHLLCCNYSSSFEEFSILNKETDEFKVKIMESLPMLSVLNKADSSLLLEVFWYNISGYRMMFYEIM